MRGEVSLPLAFAPLSTGSSRRPRLGDGNTTAAKAAWAITSPSRACRRSSMIGRQLGSVPLNPVLSNSRPLPSAFEIVVVGPLDVCDSPRHVEMMVLRTSPAATRDLGTGRAVDGQGEGVYGIGEVCQHAA